MALAKAEIMGRGKNKKKKNCFKGGDGSSRCKIGSMVKPFLPLNLA